MSLFSAPTDSFYKFLAVGGLIIFIAGCALIYQDYNFENSIIEKYRAEQLLLQNEIELLSYELDFSQKYIPMTDSLETYFGKPLSEIQFNDSIAKLILFNLPDTLQSKTKELMIRKNILEQTKVNINNMTSWNTKHTLIIVPIYIGEIFALIGFLLWYEKIQKPINRQQASEETKQLLQGDIWFENCQSCMKTFFYEEELGTEEDGSINKIFCKECYSDGYFIEPELTYKVALSRLKVNLKRFKYWNPIERYYKIKKLKRSIRWERKRLW